MSTEPKKTLRHYANYPLSVRTGWQCSLHSRLMAHHRASVCRALSVWKEGTGTMKRRRWRVLCSRFDCNYRLCQVPASALCQNLPAATLLLEVGQLQKTGKSGKATGCKLRAVLTEIIINAEVRTRYGRSTRMDLLKTDHGVRWVAPLPTFGSFSLLYFLYSSFPSFPLLLPLEHQALDRLQDE